MYDTINVCENWSEINAHMSTSNTLCNKKILLKTSFFIIGICFPMSSFASNGFFAILMTAQRFPAYMDGMDAIECNSSHMVDRIADCINDNAEKTGHGDNQDRIYTDEIFTCLDNLREPDLCAWRRHQDIAKIDTGYMLNRFYDDIQKKRKDFVGKPFNWDLLKYTLEKRGDVVQRITQQMKDWLATH